MATSPVQIRRAAPADYEAVGALTVAAYDEFLSEAESDYRRHLAGAAKRDQEAELWVAELEGAIVGTVTYCPVGSPWHELARDGEGEFRMLAVHPDAQGRGVGRALTSHCDDRARAEGMRGMVLCSMQEMKAAHHVYEQLGYSRDPDRDWEPVPGVLLLAFAKAL
jgi:ribosomal protein S18 acetylase RimI-like enzyme